MKPMSLNQAIALAAEAHSNQNRWDGTPYILHPIRVMQSLESREEMMVGILHDIIEDTDVTESQLLTMGCDGGVVAAVVLLSKTRGEDYKEYIERIKANPLARKVKLADLTDNLNILNLRRLSDKHRDRIDKYLDALAILK
jgi:guanosine-3',5'-bis(diphosphate) 3'-pyrophosphohydrolase